MKSKAYWKKRAKANMDAVQQLADARISKIGRAYQIAARDLTADVEKIIGTYAKRFDLTRDQAIAVLKAPFDEDSRAYSYRMSRAEAIKASSRKQAERLGALTASETEAQRKETALASYRSARKALYERVGASANFANPDIGGLMRAIGTSWTGESYSQRIWGNTARLAATLDEKITAAFLSGKSNFAIENEIMEQFGCSFREAERLVRAETSYVCNEAAAQSYLDSGLEAFEFLCTEDSSTCKLCAEQDGQITPLARRKIGKNAPPMHPWCRCTVLPAVESAGTERSGRGAHGENKLFPKGMHQPDYVQWLNDGAPDDVSAWMTKRKA